MLLIYIIQYFFCTIALRKHLPKVKWTMIANRLVLYSENMSCNNFQKILIGNNIKPPNFLSDSVMRYLMIKLCNDFRSIVSFSEIEFSSLVGSFRAG